MAFFEWKSEYSTGIKNIDEQHKVIVNIMNDLFNSIQTNKTEEKIKSILVELLKYANYHFNLELKLFKKYHYNDEQKHIEEHNHYIEKVKTLMLQNYLNNKTVPVEVLHYLREWFTNHMIKTDMEYCRYYNQKEIMKEIDEFLENEQIQEERSS